MKRLRLLSNVVAVAVIGGMALAWVAVSSEYVPGTVLTAAASTPSSSATPAPTFTPAIPAIPTFPPLPPVDNTPIISEDCYAEGESPILLDAPLTSSVGADGQVHIIRSGYRILDCLWMLNFQTDALVDGVWQAVAGDGIIGDDAETRDVGPDQLPDNATELRLTVNGNPPRDGYPPFGTRPVVGPTFIFGTVDLASGATTTAPEALATGPVGPRVTVTTSPAPAAVEENSYWFRAGPVTVSLALEPGAAPTTRLLAYDGRLWTPYTAPITANGDGPVFVGYRTVNGGATPVYGSSGLIAIRIDAVAPQVQATTDSAARTVTLAATDPLSGVASIEYRIGSAPSWSRYVTPITVPDSPTATTITYRATDRAGNVSPEGTTTVAGKPVPAVVLRVTATATCVSGKAVVVATTTNRGSGAVSLRSFALSSVRSTKSVDPGATATSRFPSTTTRIPAGSVIVIGTATTKPSASVGTARARYSAIDCR